MHGNGLRKVNAYDIQKFSKPVILCVLIVGIRKLILNEGCTKIGQMWCTKGACTLHKPDVIGIWSEYVKLFSGTDAQFSTTRLHMDEPQSSPWLVLKVSSNFITSKQNHEHINYSCWSFFYLFHIFKNSYTRLRVFQEFIPVVSPQETHTHDLVYMPLLVYQWAKHLLGTPVILYYLHYPLFLMNESVLRSHKINVLNQTRIQQQG